MTSIDHTRARLGFQTLTVKDWKDLQYACKCVFALMRDEEWHNVNAILKVSGQREGLRRMRELRGLGFTVEEKRVGDSRHWLYRLVMNPDLVTEEKQREMF